MIKIKQYVSPDGESTFEKWFLTLNNAAAAKITTAIYKLELGNFSTVKSVGSGVYEQKVDFGPGYRVYFGNDGNEIIILLCGGTKKRQFKDVENAKKYWQEYKDRKKKR